MRYAVADVEFTHWKLKNLCLDILVGVYMNKMIKANMYFGRFTAQDVMVDIRLVGSDDLMHRDAVREYTKPIEREELEMKSRMERLRKRREAITKEREEQEKKKRPAAPKKPTQAKKRRRKTKKK